MNYSSLTSGTMPLIPDEEQFDSRMPPWAIDAGVPGEQPEAMLSADAAGDPERLLEIDPEPDPRAESEPDKQQPPQGAAQAQAGFVPSGPQARRDAKFEGRRQREQETWIRRNPEAVREFQQKTEEFQRIHGQQAVQARAQAQQQPPKLASRPPAFPRDWVPQGGGFQQVVANLDIPDEVPLAEDRVIAREEPGLAMESLAKIAQVEDQIASTTEVQSQNIHSALSRLRDVEAAFMRTNYV